MKWAGSRDKIFSPSGRGKTFLLTSLFIELIDLSLEQSTQFSGARVAAPFHYYLPMPAPPTQSPILTFEEARRVVEQHASQISPPNTEILSLLQAAGRVLAEPITADRDIPPFPRSTRDGYAVRAADLATLPAKLRVIGEIKAGPLRPVETESPRNLFHHDGCPGARRRERRSNGRIHIAKRRFRRNHKGARRRRKHRRSRCRGQTWRPLARYRHTPQRSSHRLAASVGKSQTPGLRSSPYSSTNYRRRDRRYRRRPRPHADPQLQQLFAGGTDPTSRRRARASCQSLPTSPAASAN